MKLFLTLKHWQVFALQMGPAVISQCFLFSGLQSGAAIGSFLLLFAIGMVFYAGTLFAWLYAVASGLRSRLPATVPMRLNWFRTALFVPAFYITAILAYLLFGSVADMGGSQVALLAVLIVPLHLLSMAGMLYCIYFTAKLLKAVELQRPLDLSDYLGELFLIWFFPIGIWLIQPRVNALVGATPLVTRGPNPG
ncbi:hypothetical protein [Hymenobacter properus]|uniref:Uncharacterized protein n=1 Tax=Hymenobacter properus TaxID=2791026 RepID=A0A931FMS2_9BACT|nr:hypothetical protein [Hymenobacter properus]MBF9144300.1 hypothetical protein [Hymenobacter properus]MBR7723118.1 hypothetical protein [Microvirga sp. SRT04]